MKRFFSLMLVALLLVSALPFAASAADVTCKTCGKAAERVVGSSFDETGDCLTDGKETYVCNNASCAQKGAWFTVTVKAPGKHEPKDVVTKEATCTATGTYIVKCATCDNVIRGEQTIPVTAHSYNDGIVTTPAGCGSTGVKTTTCSGCGDSYTTEIPATGNHTFVNGVCNVCQTPDGLRRKEVTFVIDNVNGVSKIYKQTFIDERTLTVPTAELISNYEFKGWYPAPNGSGNPIVSGMTWNEDTMPNTYYAWYIYNPNKDGMSNITVTARCYIDGVGNSYLDVPVLTQALPDNTNVFEWLQTNKNTTILTSVYNKVDTTKYEWKNRYFYNHNGTEVLTEQTVFADGPKAILIKLEEKDNTTRANVQLYLHTSTTAENPFRILDMNGYTSGMNVTRTAAANLVKEYYSYKTIGNLFTQSDWNALQNGENVAGRTSVYLSDNGTYKIHVVVTNASSKSSSNADTTNPKTGDYITIAVGTMVMAAAAFITLAEMKKRKMI